MTEKRAALYIVATPIGNLGDMSARAVEVLKEADLIAAEDTRRAGVLLNHIGISGKRFISYYDQVEEDKSESIIKQMIQNNLKVALISDAGTPCISDPGYRLVSLAHKNGIPVYPIPGACALTALISAAGLPSNRFLFVGFLPTKTIALRKEIESWRLIGSGSIVFYESPRRLGKTLAQIAEIYPAAELCIGRELTKLHEEVVLLSVSDALKWSEQPESALGEAAVMVFPHSGVGESEDLTDELKGCDEKEVISAAQKAYAEGASLKDLLERYKDVGFTRSELYRILLKAK